MGDKDQVFNQIQELLQHAGANLNAIKQEMVEHFQLIAAPATTVQNVPENTAATTQLTEAISKLKVSQSTKIPKYVKSDNFSHYCERFQEYVLISRVESPNLHMYFLQNVDDGLPDIKRLKLRRFVRNGIKWINVMQNASFIF